MAAIAITGGQFGALEISAGAFPAVQQRRALSLSMGQVSIEMPSSDGDGSSINRADSAICIGASLFAPALASGAPKFYWS